MLEPPLIGCAGWSLRTEHQALFGAGAAIWRATPRASTRSRSNSSFYKPHRPATYARWAASVFLGGLRQRHAGDVCLEPRHLSWFEPGAEGLLMRHRVARVAADPALCPAAGEAGGWRGLSYFRLHGSPRLYCSAYGDESVAGWHRRLLAAARESKRTWCIFDNTAEGAATQGSALKHPASGRRGA